MRNNAKLSMKSVHLRILNKTAGPRVIRFPRFHCIEKKRAFESRAKAI